MFNSVGALRVKIYALPSEVFATPKTMKGEFLQRTHNAWFVISPLQFAFRITYPIYPWNCMSYLIQMTTELCVWSPKNLIMLTVWILYFCHHIKGSLNMIRWALYCFKFTHKGLVPLLWVLRSNVITSFRLETFSISGNVWFQSRVKKAK